MADGDEVDEAAQAPRDQTDDSLRLERARTDARVAEKRAAVEEAEEKVVRTARKLADEVVQEARSEADLQHPASAGDAAGIDRERARADLRLEGSRSSEDASLREQQVERSRFLAEFLTVEREATDADLIRERDYSDGMVSNRDELLATVSHDMRNLLGGLNLNVEMLVKHAPEGSAGATMRRHAAASQRLVGRMTRLVNDLLDVVSIDAGKLSIVPERAEVGKLVRETIDAFEPIALAKGVALEGIAAPTPLDAQLDVGRVLQVLANLVSNAIKFTAAGGRISISVCVLPERSEIQFTVTDTGIGIPEESLAGVFERFRQISKDRRGLGLGLHISKCIVEAQGGRMWAESQVGVGSAFHLALPVSPPGSAR